MATFVKDKSSAFKKTGDQTALPTKQRSEARMKAYTSATDARAWVNNMTENKQYIIDLMGTDLPKHKQLGKYVPVDVLVKTLMGNKDADIKRLNSIIKEMEGFIYTLNLNSKDMKTYTKLRTSWGAGEFGDGVMSQPRRNNIPLSESKYGRTSSEVRVPRPLSTQGSQRTSSESRIRTPRSETLPTSASEADSSKSEHHQRAHSRPRHSSGSAESYSTIPTKCVPIEPTTESVINKTKPSWLRDLPLKVESSHKDVQVGQSVASRESQTQTLMTPKEMVDKEQQVSYEGTQLKAKSSSSSLKSRIPVPGPTGDSKLIKTTQTPVVSSHDIQTAFDDSLNGKKSSSSFRTCFDCERNMQTTRQTIMELESLKIALDERNYKLQATERELTKIKGELMEQENIDDDIAIMAKQIANLRASGSTDELKIVSTELQLLKKYCQKLIYIKSDNKKLKQENDNLRSQSNVTRSVEAMKEYHHTLVDIGANSSARRADHPSDTDLRSKLQSKIVALKDVTKQRDKMQANIVRLEGKLKRYEHLNTEIKMFKDRAKVLDTVIEEKLELERRLQRVANLENEMGSLRMRANKADELQRALEHAQNKLLQMHDQRSLQQRTPFVIESGTNIAALIEDLRYKTREAEVLRIDRDRMRVRLEELSHYEQESKMLQGKCRMMEAVRNERDIYKSKTMELANLKDDCISLREQAEQVHTLTDERDALVRKVNDLERVIADQENEISRLVMHIDRLSKGADDHQDRIKEIITDLRLEIENKSLLITNAENQLAEVQTQLKQTIDSLTKETSALKRQVYDADASCTVFKARLERFSKQLMEANVALEKEKKTCSRFRAEVIALNKDNQRLQEIADRMNDLTDAGKLESILRKSHEALQTASEKLTNYEIAPMHSSTADFATNTRLLPRSIHTAAATSELADSRDQVSSIITGIMNIPTHDYGATILQRDEKISIWRDVAHSMNALDLQSPSGLIQSSGRSIHGVQSAPPGGGNLTDVTICEATPATNQGIVVPENTIENITCACKEVQHPSKSRITKAVDNTVYRIPPCRRYADASTICIDNSEDLLRLQKLENEGKLSLENITCVCKGVQADVCKCIDVVCSAYSMNAIDRPSGPLQFSEHNVHAVQSAPPLGVNFADHRTIGVHSSDTMEGIIDREDGGVKSFDKITCVCKGVQHSICVCHSDQSETANIPVQRTPPCRQNVDASTICTDNADDQFRLKQLEQEGKLSLEDITCVCKGIQAKICKCVDEESSTNAIYTLDGQTSSREVYEVQTASHLAEGETICVDTSETIRRMVDLEDRGVITLESITCVCRGVQHPLCVCKSGITQTAKSTAQRVPPSHINVDASTICIDKVDEQLRLRQLEEKGKLSLDNITCVCRGVQTNILHGEMNNIGVGTEIDQDNLQAVEDEGKQPLQNVHKGGRVKVSTNNSGSSMPPCRRGLDVGTICVDNIYDQQRLQDLENEGKLPLEIVTCVCRGMQTKVCKCTNMSYSESEINSDNVHTEMQTAKVASLNSAKAKSASTIHSDHDYSKVSPSRSLEQLSDTVCVDNIKDQYRLQELENQGVLSFEKITCACRGVQTEICECKLSEIDSKYSETTHSESDIICVCKGIQSEVCECKSAAISPIGSSTSMGVNTTKDLTIFEELETETKLPLRNILCECKSVQHEICECKSRGTNPQYVPSFFSGQPTRTTSGIHSESTSNDIFSISKDINPCECDELKAELLRMEIDLNELKQQHDTLGLENQALRKHASELQEVAKSQITSLSNELRKSREDWAKTDDSKAVADYQEQNKLLQKEIAMLKKKQCECSEMYKENLRKALKKHSGDLDQGLTESIKELQERPVDKKKSFLSSMSQSELKKNLSDSNVKRDVDNLRNQLTDSRAELTKPSTDDKLQKELDALRKQLEKCQSQIDVYEKQSSEKPTSALVLPAVQKENDDLKKQLDRLKEQLAETPEKRDVTQLEKGDPLSQENDDLKNQLDQLKKELDQAKSLKYLPVKDSKQDPPKKEADDIWGQQLENCTQELDDLRKQLENCRKDLEMQKKVGPVESAHKDLKPDNDDLLKQLADLRSQLAATKNDLENERNTPKGDSSELDDLRNQLKALQNQLQDANKRLQDCEQHLEEEKKKLEIVKKKQPSALSIAQATAENDKKLDDLQKQLADAKKQLTEERKKPFETGPGIGIKAQIDQQTTMKPTVSLSKGIQVTKDQPIAKSETPQVALAQAIPTPGTEAGQVTEKPVLLSSTPDQPQRSKLSTSQATKDQPTTQSITPQEAKGQLVDKPVPSSAIKPTTPAQIIMDQPIDKDATAEPTKDQLTGKPVPVSATEGQPSAKQDTKDQPTAKDNKEQEMAQAITDKPDKQPATPQETKGQPVLASALEDKPSAKQTTDQPITKLTTPQETNVEKVDEPLSASTAPDKPSAKPTAAQADRGPPTTDKLPGQTTTGQPITETGPTAPDKPSAKPTAAQADRGPPTTDKLPGQTTTDQPITGTGTTAPDKPSAKPTAAQADKGSPTTDKLPRQTTTGQPITGTGTTGAKGKVDVKPAAIDANGEESTVKELSAQATKSTPQGATSQPLDKQLAAAAIKDQTVTKDSPKPAITDQAITKPSTLQGTTSKPTDKNVPASAATDQSSAKPAALQVTKDQPIDKKSPAQVTADQTITKSETPKEATAKPLDKQVPDALAAQKPIGEDSTKLATTDQSNIKPETIQETVGQSADKSVPASAAADKFSAKPTDTQATDEQIIASEQATQQSQEENIIPPATNEDESIERIEAPAAKIQPGDKTDKPEKSAVGAVVGASKSAKEQAAVLAEYKKRLAESQQLVKDSSMKLSQLEKELEKTKKQSIEAIRSVRSSYERDIMIMQEKYIEGIESLQTSHEELISQDNKELEEEIESLRKDSIKKQATIDDLRCMCFEEKKKKPALCQVQCQAMDIQMECVCDDMLFAYLLRKVLYCGLESLTFEDLQYMHTKICEATAKVMSTVKRGDCSFVPCSCDYKSRQTQAQTQVAKLQMEVALERQRLESLKKALDIERSTQVAMTQHFQRQAKTYIPTYTPHHIQTARLNLTKPDCAIKDYCRCLSAVELNPKRKQRLEPVPERQKKY